MADRPYSTKKGEGKKLYGSSVHPGPVPLRITKYFVRVPLTSAKAFVSASPYHHKPLRFSGLQMLVKTQHHLQDVYGASLRVAFTDRLPVMILYTVNDRFTVVLKVCHFGIHC